jgi:hypothetical protein
MAIFGRWGDKVFETTDPYSGWNGFRGGIPATAGTYVWMIQYTDILGTTQAVRGVLILVRWHGQNVPWVSNR